MEFLRHVIFGGVTVAHVVALVIVIIAINFVWRKLSKKERPNVYERVKCLECGWVGDVSKYHRVCRKCGGNTLQKENDGSKK